jgi:hypothetical protein
LKREPGPPLLPLAQRPFIRGCIPLWSGGATCTDFRESSDIDFREQHSVAYTKRMSHNEIESVEQFAS